jgi:hypothetical protein
MCVQPGVATIARASSTDSFVLANTDNARSVQVSPMPRAWGRFHLANGLAIWKESSSEAQAVGESAPGCPQALPPLDSYMVSKRICGTPKQVIKTLLRLDGRGSCFWAFDTVSDVRELGSTDHAVLFKATMAPPVRSPHAAMTLWCLRPTPHPPTPAWTLTWPSSVIASCTHQQRPCTVKVPSRAMAVAWQALCTVRHLHKTCMGLHIL